MFGLLQPDKVKVGQRIKEIKESMNLSFTDLGNRLGLKKPTISSYVQGYALAPENVINQLSSISGKPVGWFYFGDIEEYIADYLQLKGQNRIVQEHPEVVKAIKEEFYTGKFKNSAWENEVGYPCEGFMDDYFYELQQEVIKKEIQKMVRDQIKKLSITDELSKQKKEEAVTVITSRIIEYLDVAGEFNYEKKDDMIKMVKREIDKYDFFADSNFEDQYLVGKLINILVDQQKTVELINILSEELTNKSFSGRFGGEELIESFEALRPELIRIYSKVSTDELEDWFREDIS
ncbi:helix-turn-helix domain-containing protein [Enterococcus faecalis]|uniref:helix-turn-helix domain-containing protein n=1 Tax=Enterococcus faecalis TaxID=1351 RepID=UPI001780A09B|nr:helix-turn-helix transcriptional regulator [Enterococcus faecalis]MBD9836382.1 helix-turn-helix transcriptional regulator [Enterococcus faecalis]MBD9892289.1 helix-turn-helix transcriptional regulator [Enterococcus faecalis]MBW4168716.1 helix-turn-helix transcriptional regulator [Enterococcus faecalis]MBW4173705.1 helix-turn-helix transcriptional regulator [Enterococcus faecalis]MBW4176594.1 helix-turn-helix transcriptional regulator [Enterococcus faecalis]